MTRQESPTTIAILGSDTVVNNALSLLLRGTGYDTKLIKRDLIGLADGLLEGVDVLLLSPDLSDRARESLLSVVRGNTKTQTIPVLTLSAAVGEVRGDESVPVAWPRPIEELVRHVETVLAPATSEEG